MKMKDSSSPEFFFTGAVMDNTNDCDKEWSCNSCTFSNSSAVSRCEMCNTLKPQSLSGWELESKGSVIDLTNMNNDDGPRANHNHLSFKKINSNHTWAVASTESARKRRKRKISRDDSASRCGHHGTTTGNVKDVIEINDTDDEQNNIVVSSRLVGKKNTSLRRSMETGHVKSRHDDNQVERSIVYSGHVTADGLKIDDDENLSELDESSFLSSSSSSFPRNKSKMKSTLFGSVVPDMKKKRHSESSTEKIKKRSSQTTMESKTQDLYSNSEYSKTPDNMYQNKKEHFPVSCTGNSTGQNGTITDNPSFSQARHDALMKQARVKMKSTFGISSLRNLQPIAIESSLKGQSQIVIMATGGGKSLCYQLPAVVLPGLTVVISPLIALMVDQVQQLKSKGVAAELICSSQSQKENQKVMQRLRDATLQQQKQKGGKKVATASLESKLPMVKLLYCTPELLQTTRFQDVLMNLHRVNMLSLIVIDEAHCMSTWGHDFRPAYRKLSWLRTSFSNVPCMACTATATKKVIEEIKQVLCFRSGDKVHMSTFNRANIHYEVRCKDIMSEEGALQDLVKTIHVQHKKCDKNDKKCSGIVYVHKRQDTMMISSKLQQAGIAAEPYHAGLKVAERKRVQEEWTNGTVQVAIATVAFGMGIDLAHVRYVIHWTLSKSIEGFYQESGRAGRDGLPSLSILYYSRDDASKFAFLIRKTLENKKQHSSPSVPEKSSSRDMDALDKMIEYCTSPCCRRKYILRHFGEDIDPKKVCHGTCDYCLNPQKVSDAMSTIQNRSNVSRAIRDVKRQQSFGFVQHNTSYYDDDDEEDYVDHDMLLQEWGYGNVDPSTSSPIRHFHKKKTPAHAGFSTAGGTQIHGGRSKSTAHSILSKYETMEQQQQQQQPQPNKTRTKLSSSTQTTTRDKKTTSRSNLWSKLTNNQDDDFPKNQFSNKHPYRPQHQQQQQPMKSTHMTIPSHLVPSKINTTQKNSNSSSITTTTTTTTTTPSSTSSKDYASAANAIQAELEEIRKKRESLLAKLSQKSQSK